MYVVTHMNQTAASGGPAGKNVQIFPGERRIFSGVNGASASLLAFITASAVPAVPAFPAHFASSSNVIVDVTTYPILMSGISPVIANS